MASLKQLHGIAHDIAHHARSSLAYLFPHLWEACQAAGLTTVSMSLLDSDPYPASLPENGPLRVALNNLRERFERMVRHRGLDVTILTDAQLEFTFPPRFGDGSVYGVRSSLSTDKQRYEWTFPVPDMVTLVRAQRESRPVGEHAVLRQHEPGSSAGDDA